MTSAKARSRPAAVGDLFAAGHRPPDQTGGLRMSMAATCAAAPQTKAKTTVADNELQQTPKSSVESQQDLRSQYDTAWCSALSRYRPDLGRRQQSPGWQAACAEGKSLWTRLRDQKRPAP
jgi:hypothetical protein